VLDTSGTLMHSAAPYEDAAIRAIPLQKAQNNPRNDVKDEIERVFGKGHIMYHVAVAESELNPLAESGTGPVGVFQIAGITWKHHKCSGDRYIARDNIRCAKKIYDANGLTDWRWSEHEGFGGGWGQYLSTSRQ
jgi:hypothetical protein